MAEPLAEVTRQDRVMAAAIRRAAPEGAAQIAAEWARVIRSQALSHPRSADEALAEVKRLREEREEMIQAMRRSMEDMGTSSLSHHILRPYVGWERKG